MAPIDSDGNMYPRWMFPVANAVNEACAIIEAADARVLASDGPAGGLPPDMTLDEWKRLYRTLRDVHEDHHEVLRLIAEVDAINEIPLDRGLLEVGVTEEGDAGVWRQGEPEAIGTGDTLIEALANVARSYLLNALDGAPEENEPPGADANLLGVREPE